eukprot:scaffold320732_cov32-Tisochrysis_lutea.AAC.4
MGTAPICCDVGSTTRPYWRGARIHPSTGCLYLICSRTWTRCRAQQQLLSLRPGTWWSQVGVAFLEGHLTDSGHHSRLCGMHSSGSA